MSHDPEFFAELARTERYDAVLKSMGESTHRDDVSGIVGQSRNEARYVDAETLLMTVLNDIDPSLFNMNTGLGCREVINLACQSRDAYMAFCEQHDVGPDISELRGALMRSAHLPDRFMDMSRRAWKTFGTAFATTGDEPLRYEGCNIVVVLDDEGNLSFDVDPDGWQSAVDELTLLGKARELDNGSSCPARGLFMNKLWKTTVGYLCQDETLFPADIAVHANR